MRLPKAPVRAIFFDIDGTLLGWDHKMPESTLRALSLAREKGVLLFIATGRYTEMALFLRELFDFDGYLALNGQYCFDRAGNVLHALPIDPADIRRLIELEQTRTLPCIVCEDKACFIAGDGEGPRLHFTSHGLTPPPPYDVSRLETHPVYQLCTYDPQTTDPVLLAHLPHVRITWAAAAAGRIHDVLPVGGGKDVAIRAVCAKLGIGLESILVFGDGLNDVDMLRNTGFSVAMGNAVPEVKAVADRVTDDVDADGVLNALLALGVL